LPVSKLIATTEYKGPPIDICGEPAITIENVDGTALTFLVPTFDPITKEISINIDDFKPEYKGSYDLFAVFSLPGEKAYDMGI
jgi:hypothetical protein